VYHSSIVATAGNGPGGNITIDPEFAIIYDSLISANDASGGEGNIHLNATYLFESGSQIFATGVVESPIPSADLTGALVLLNGAPVDAETRLEDTCAVEVQGDFSSFLELGQGDIEAAPNEAQGQTGDAGRHARHQTQARKVKAWHPAMIQL
jgi:large exoprotein involved in heme utilization and adhesion